MKNVHFVAYAMLTAATVFLGYSTIDRSAELDDMRQAASGDRQAINDLLRYASVNSNCDTQPSQLSAAMGRGYDLIENDKGNPEVAHLAFRAEYEGNRLVGIEVVNRGTVAVCGSTVSAR